MIQRKYVQYTWRTMLHIIHDNNWIHKWSRWIKMLCQLIISSAFFSIFFRQVIMNIDFVKMIEHLDNREDYYRSYNQKIMVLQVIQQIICEMIFDGRKFVNTDIFFEVSNIRTNVQNDSSEFEGLLHKMVSQKPFINQDICHVNLNGERSICTVSTYIK